MAKWGLLGAHRYLEPDSGSARTVGRDGRALRRPWRTVSAEVARAAALRRRTRRQPFWPRPLGFVLVALAIVAAVHPVDSIHAIPTHVEGSSSAGPGPCPLRLVADSPVGQVDGAPAHFEWRGAGSSGRAALVVWDASYAEIARFDGIAGPRWEPPASLAARLIEASTFHWFVETKVGNGVVRSALATCEIR